MYGNINPSFTHAYDTEKFLIGRDIFNNRTLQSALHVLEQEINPDVRPPYPPPCARKKVALGLFYKVSTFHKKPNCAPDRFRRRRKLCQGNNEILSFSFHSVLSNFVQKIY